MDKIERVKAPLPTPVYPVEYEGSLTQTEAMGQFQYSLNKVIDSQNKLIDEIGDFTISQATGQSTTYVMSQKATTDALDEKFDKRNISQNTGSSTTSVMSQKATTDALDDKVSKYPVNMTFKVSTGGLVTYNGDFDTVKSLINSRAGKLIIDSPKNKSGLLTPSFMSDDTIALTTTLITSDGESYLEEIVIKSDGATASYTVMPNNIYTSYTYFYSPNNDGNYQCNKTYTEISNESREVGRRYRFYNGDLTKQNCELAMCNFAQGVNQFYLEGVYSSDKITNTSGKNILSQTIVRVTINDNNNVNVVLNTTGVDDSQDTTKTSTIYSPSNRYVNENFVEYSDLENDLIYADPEKAPSMDLVSQNFAPIDFTKAELTHDPVTTESTGEVCSRSLSFLPDDAFAVEFDVSFVGSSNFSNVDLFLNLGAVINSQVAKIAVNSYPAHCKITIRDTKIPTTPEVTATLISYEILGGDQSASGMMKLPYSVGGGNFNNLNVMARATDSTMTRVILYNIRYWKK